MDPKNFINLLKDSGLSNSTIDQLQLFFGYCIIDQKSRILNYALDIERRNAETLKRPINTESVKSNFKIFWKLVSEYDLSSLPKLKKYIVRIAHKHQEGLTFDVMAYNEKEAEYIAIHKPECSELIKGTPLIDVRLANPYQG